MDQSPAGRIEHPYRDRLALPVVNGPEDHHVVFQAVLALQHPDRPRVDLELRQLGELGLGGRSVLGLGRHARSVEGIDHFQLAETLAVLEVFRKEDRTPGSGSHTDEKSIPEGELVGPVKVDRAQDIREPNQHEAQAGENLDLATRDLRLNPQLAGGSNEIFLQNLGGQNTTSIAEAPLHQGQGCGPFFRLAVIVCIHQDVGVKKPRDHKYRPG
jgi:hypothetical protein